MDEQRGDFRGAPLGEHPLFRHQVAHHNEDEHHRHLAYHCQYRFHAVPSLSRVFPASLEKPLWVVCVVLFLGGKLLGLLPPGGLPVLPVLLDKHHGQHHQHRGGEHPEGNAPAPRKGARVGIDAVHQQPGAQHQEVTSRQEKHLVLLGEGENQNEPSRQNDNGEHEFHKSRSFPGRYSLPIILETAPNYKGGPPLPHRQKKRPPLSRQPLAFPFKRGYRYSWCGGQSGCTPQWCCSTGPQGYLRPWPRRRCHRPRRSRRPRCRRGR